MFGKIIKRYCETCRQEKRIVATVGYNVDGEDYFTGYYCDVCNSDLCKEDRKILKTARDNGKDIDVVMH